MDDPTDPKLPEVEPPGKHRHSFRDDWDPRAIIALVTVIGAFMLAIVSLILDSPEHSVPAWVVALIGGIGIYYYKNGKEGS